MRALFLIGLFLASPAAPAADTGVIDRVAVVIGNRVLTETEVLEELRVAQFLNGEPLDLAPVKRREAAERLVDQELIRRDIEIGGFTALPADQADSMLAQLKRERFKDEAEYRAALARYGLTEAALKERLLWQLTVLRFTDVRFNPSIPSAPEEESANRSSQGAAPPAENGVEQAMEAWLKQARADTKIQFKPEAFQ